jgi:membrane associated rhomboid family serine protease
MGIYDRDYERSYDTGSGWRDSGSYGGGGMGGGFASWTANSKLLAVMAAIYVVQVLLERPLQGQFSDYLSLPADVWREPWRAYSLATYALLHSTQNIFHLLFNGLALFFFGRIIEMRLGGREYLTFFFAAAIFAGLTWCVVENVTSGGAPRGILLGASGGIAGVLVLFALWYPHVQVYLMGILPVPAWVMAILFLAQDIMGAMKQSGEVAYTAHLGGAFFGFLYFRYGWRLSNWLPQWIGGSGIGGPGLGGNLSGKSFKSLLKRKPNLRVHRNEDDDSQGDSAEERVDEILRKIQSQGQASLTREEQRILEQARRSLRARRLLPDPPAPLPSRSTRHVVFPHRRHHRRLGPRRNRPRRGLRRRRRARAEARAAPRVGIETRRGLLEALGGRDRRGEARGGRSRLQPRRQRDRRRPLDARGQEVDCR